MRTYLIDLLWPIYDHPSDSFLIALTVAEIGKFGSRKSRIYPSHCLTFFPRDVRGISFTFNTHFFQISMKLANHMHSYIVDMPSHSAHPVHIPAVAHFLRPTCAIDSHIYSTSPIMIPFHIRSGSYTIADTLTRPYASNLSTSSN